MRTRARELLALCARSKRGPTGQYGMMLRMTLAAFFNIRANSLNSLRLLFATLVIVSHSWPVAGFGGDPQFGDFKLGEFAVAAFFAISGYLITGSRLSNRALPYFRARILRIFPGYWVCLLVTACVAAPIAGLSRGGWDLADAAGYVYNNVFLVVRQWTIGGTLDGAPWPGAWNGPLWTLMYEFACYFLIAALFAVSRLRRGWVVLAVFAAFTVAGVMERLGLLPNNINLKNLFVLGTYFFAGAAVFMYRDRIPASSMLASAAAALTVTATAFHWGTTIAPLGIAYLCIWTSAQFPRLLVERIGDGSIDISYGMYVYGWVMQQLVIVAGLHNYGVLMLIAVSVIGTIPLAAISWFTVEKQALRFKRVGAHRRRNSATTTIDLTA